MLNLKVVSENSDGTANVAFDFDKQFEEHYLKVTGRKEVVDSEVGAFVQDMIIGAFKDGANCSTPME
jgi:hypothetical protein